MMSLKQQFAKYVSLNILGMMGLSLYVLADSYFIALAEGANGLTALNLVLPIYNLIYAIGAMIGVGSAIRFNIAKSQKSEQMHLYFFQAIAYTFLISIIFIIIGLGFTEDVLVLLGADHDILLVGIPYTKIFMTFTPFFMWNHVFNAFVRNDGAPTIAMAATLSSSLFNIVFDYVLMFPLGMGMRGAALATALSPVLGIAICSIHLLSKRSQVKWIPSKLSVKNLIRSSQTGISAFVTEMSSGIITLTFNFLIISIAGNVGVAAYGVVANVAIVAIAVFNGIAQGSQPLISAYYGRKDSHSVKSLQKLALLSAFVAAVIIYSFLFMMTDEVVALFNSEGSKELAIYGFEGVRLYFIGIFFAGLNIVGSSYFSATEDVKKSFIISILRGFIFILIFAFILAYLFKMRGVWMAYVAAEAATFVVMCLIRKRKMSD